MVFSVVLLLACYILLINVVIRCADGRIGVNGVAGIRTADIMANEQTWLAGHKAARMPTLAGIYAAMLVLVPAPLVSGEAWQAIFLLGSCLVVLAGILVGAAKGSAAARVVLAEQR